MFPRLFYRLGTRRQLALARIERDVRAVIHVIEGTNYSSEIVSLLRVIDEVYVLRAMCSAPFPKNVAKTERD